MSEAPGCGKVSRPCDPKDRRSPSRTPEGSLGAGTPVGGGRRPAPNGVLRPNSARALLRPSFDLCERRLEVVHFFRFDVLTMALAPDTSQVAPWLRCRERTSDGVNAIPRKATAIMPVHWFPGCRCRSIRFGVCLRVGPGENRVGRAVFRFVATERCHWTLDSTGGIDVKTFDADGNLACRGDDGRGLGGALRPRLGPGGVGLWIGPLHREPYRCGANLDFGDVRHRQVERPVRRLCEDRHGESRGQLCEPDEHRADGRTAPGVEWCAHC